MFNPIEINTDWGFLLTFLGTLIAIIGIFLKIYEVGKDIRISDVYLNKYLTKPDELNDEIKIIFKNVEIESLHKIQIFLKNSGSISLNDNDFYIKPTVELKGFTNILYFEVFTSNEFTKIEARSVDVTKLELIINDFEPKTFIKIEITYESIGSEYEPYVETYLKNREKEVLSLTDFLKDKKYSNTINTYLYIPTIVFLIVLGLTNLIVKFGLGIKIDNPEIFNIGWKILYYAPSGLFALITLIYISFRNVDWFEGWRRIQQWYNKVNCNP